MLDFHFGSPGGPDMISFSWIVAPLPSHLHCSGSDLRDRNIDRAHVLSVSPPFFEWWGLSLMDHRSITTGNHI